MRLFSYIVAHDTGFAPNPFGGCCTLATCKPKIRLHAAVGDWIVGLSPKPAGNRIVYAMRVDEKWTHAQYFTDPRFRKKIPDLRHRDSKRHVGDNCYEPLSDGGFRQLESRHSDGPRENPLTKAHDLGGVYALVSHAFHYFGAEPLELPTKFAPLIAGRGHRCAFPPALVESFVRFITDQPAGLVAPPARFVVGGTCRNRS